MYKDNFSKNLLIILKEKKLTQASLAKNIGVSKSSITNWIKKHSEPTMSNIANMTVFLDCTFEELIN